MGILQQDLRFGLRVLIKNPIYSLVVLIALALGIGANTAIFTVVNAVLLRPFPFGDAARLAVIDSGNKKAGKEQFYGAAPADFIDWREQSKTFEQMAALRGDGFDLTGVDDPESIPAAGVTINLFTTCRVRPGLG